MSLSRFSPGVFAAYIGYISADQREALAGITVFGPPFSKKRDFNLDWRFFKMRMIDSIEREYMNDSIPEFAIGDTLKVHVTVREGDKERIQVFEGVCIARKGGGSRESFTVRKVSYGVGVERKLPLHSPLIAKIEVAKRGAVRRAKLFYLRALSGKATRIKEKEYRPEKAAAKAAKAAKAAGQ